MTAPWLATSFGPGRMSEPEEIVVAIEALLTPQEKPLAASAPW
jgi:hypothetical protein